MIQAGRRLILGGEKRLRTSCNRACSSSAGSPDELIGKQYRISPKSLTAMRNRSVSGVSSLRRGEARLRQMLAAPNCFSSLENEIDVLPVALAGTVFRGRVGYRAGWPGTWNAQIGRERAEVSLEEDLTRSKMAHALPLRPRQPLSRGGGWVVKASAGSSASIQRSRVLPSSECGRNKCNAGRRRQQRHRRRINNLKDIKTERVPDQRHHHENRKHRLLLPGRIPTKEKWLDAISEAPLLIVAESQPALPK